MSDEQAQQEAEAAAVAAAGEDAAGDGEDGEAQPQLRVLVNRRSGHGTPARDQASSGRLRHNNMHFVQRPAYLAGLSAVIRRARG